MKSKLTDDPFFLSLDYAPFKNVKMKDLTPFFLEKRFLIIHSYFLTHFFLVLPSINCQVHSYVSSSTL